MKLLLENDSVACAGRSTKADCTCSIKPGANIKNQVEWRKLALNHNPSISAKGGTRLSDLRRVRLKLELLKTHQLADYSTAHLSSKIIEYAALDALVSRKSCEHFQLLIENNGLLEEKKEGGKIIAKGVLAQIGDKNNEHTWGTLSLGAAKVLVKSAEILVPNSLLPYSDGIKAKEKTFQDTCKERNPPAVVISKIPIVVNFKSLDDNAGAYSENQEMQTLIKNAVL